MGQFKDILEETAKIAKKLSEVETDNRIEAALCKYQAWSLQQMANAIRFMERVRNNKKQKIR